MNQNIFAKCQEIRWNNTGDMAEKAQIGAKFDLWPLATRKQEFSGIWHMAQIEGLK